MSVLTDLSEIPESVTTKITEMLQSVPEEPEEEIVDQILAQGAMGHQTETGVQGEEGKKLEPISIPDLDELLVALKKQNYKLATKIFRSKFECYSAKPQKGTPMLLLVHKKSDNKFTALDLILDAMTRDEVGFLHWFIKRFPGGGMPLSGYEIKSMHDVAFEKDACKCLTFLLGETKIHENLHGILETCLLMGKEKLPRYLVQYYELSLTSEDRKKLLEWKAPEKGTEQVEVARAAVWSIIRNIPLRGAVAVRS